MKNLSIFLWWSIVYEELRSLWPKGVLLTLLPVLLLFSPLIGWTLHSINFLEFSNQCTLKCSNTRVLFGFGTHLGWVSGHVGYLFGPGNRKQTLIYTSSSTYFIFKVTLVSWLWVASLIKCLFFVTIYIHLKQNEQKIPHRNELQDVFIYSHIK